MHRALLALLALALGACGTQAPHAAETSAPLPATTPTQTLPRAHPQAVQPVAGVSAQRALHASSGPAEVSVGGTSQGLAQPVSDAMVRRELSASGMSADTRQATLTPDGLAIAPVDAPPAVHAIIQAANQIAHLPYVWGGGHVTYADTGYDCSGSISFVFQAAHLLSSPIVSGGLMNWGAAGPGKWITVFANAGHTFMYVAGLRFDTVALAQTGSRWSNRAATEPDLTTFSVRHPAGL